MNKTKIMVLAMDGKHKLNMVLLLKIIVYKEVLKYFFVDIKTDLSQQQHLKLLTIYYKKNYEEIMFG